MSKMFLTEFEYKTIKAVLPQGYYIQSITFATNNITTVLFSDHHEPVICKYFGEFKLSNYIFDILNHIEIERKEELDEYTN